MITVSAPGKLMLFGEHAVVYGFPCIVTAVSERLFVSIEETDDGNITVDAPQVTNTRFVDQAIADACDALHITHHGLHISTQSGFSNKYGFGSSSAVTVATVFALATLFQKNADKKTIFDIALHTILSIQGVGSGFDVAAATYGGILTYVKGGAVLEPLHWTMDDVSFVVGYSGVKADTTALVGEVAKKREKQKLTVDRNFEAIGNIVLKAREAGDRGDWETVGKLMNFNQEYLRNLGVSTEKLETMISAAKQAGAYGAKLSGAGGGDCIIALVSKTHVSDVVQALAGCGEVVSVEMNAEGVRIEQKEEKL